MDLLSASIIAGALFIAGFSIGRLDSQERLYRRLDRVLDAVYERGLRDGEKNINAD